MEINLGQSWNNVLKDEIEKPYFKEIIRTVEEEYNSSTVFPKEENLFKAFKLTPYDKIKVLILGQDPYHGDNQACGLSFSICDGTPFPPSLRNIFKELSDDLGVDVPTSGDLSKWAEQGVFLLNSILTVRKGEACSHEDLGWEEFTDAVIKKINEIDRPIVCVLWGGFAKKKLKLINNKKFLIITSPHPSPLSSYRGFFGSKPFSRTNKYLEDNNIDKIDFSL